MEYDEEELPEPPSIQDVGLDQDKTKYYSASDVLPEYTITPIVEKKFLLDNPQELTIIRPMVNRFGKPSIIVKHKNPDLCGQLNITKPLHNELLKRLGTTPKTWENKRLRFVAEEFSNKGVSGLTIKLVD